MEENTLPKDNKRKRTAQSLAAIHSLAQQGRMQPQAVDLEEAVLGALMLEQDALNAVIDILKPEFFYKEQHQKIYSSICRLFANSHPVDILTVTNELKTQGELEFVGGAYYITQLTNRVASAANIEFHSRIISQKYIQRELIKIASEIEHDAYEDTTDVLELLDKTESSLLSIGEKNFRSDYADMQSIIREAIKEIEATKDHENGLSGVPSGFTKLDRVTSGWQKANLIILAARPSMGKTAFALTMARNIAVDFKKSVAFFSLEMSAVELVMRLISSESQLPADKLKKGNLEGHEWAQLNTKVSSLIDAPLYIDDTPALTIFELRAKCRRLKQKHDISMVFIDYLQLMQGSVEAKGNREQEISMISRQLKALAKELRIPILALSQLSRAVETRGGTKKPILSDLRESGAIEQDADIVMFIYRPDYYKIDQDEKGDTRGMADIIIAKHRNGATDEVRLRFINTFAKFADDDSTEFDTNDYISPNNEFDNAPITRTIPSKMNDMTDDVPF
ncbi:MAG: replicative DNA helicase [Bacteroidales bacterium]